jgi:hypothetical protein
MKKIPLLEEIKVNEDYATKSYYADNSGGNADENLRFDSNDTVVIEVISNTENRIRLQASITVLISSSDGIAGIELSIDSSEQIAEMSLDVDNSNSIFSSETEMEETAFEIMEYNPSVNREVRELVGIWTAEIYKTLNQGNKKIVRLASLRKS